jgi:Xaa-Pro aminopeptidase
VTRLRWTAGLAVALLLAGCSQGMSLPDYFSELGGIRDKLDAAGEKVQQEADASMQTATDEAAQLEVFRDLLTKSVAAAKTTVSQLKDLDPPEEVKEAHEAFVTAYESMIAAMEAGVESAKAARTVDEALKALFSDDAVKAGNDLDSACRDLQKVADDNEVDVDLKCTDSGSSGGEGGSAPPP